MSAPVKSTILIPLFSIGIMLLCLSCFSRTAHTTPTPSAVNPIQHFTDVDQIVAQLYAEHDYTPLWITPDGFRPQAKAIVDVLANSWQEGLNPEDYLLPAIFHHWNRTAVTQRAYLDLLLTKGLAKYITDLQWGRINPCLLDPKLFAAARHPGVNTSTLLKYSVGAKDLAGYLHNLLPSHKDYILLKEALAKYRALAKKNPWQTIPGGETLRPGMTDPRVKLITERLQIGGDLPKQYLPTSLYSETVKKGVQRFQTRFGLEPDGIIGPQTLAAMNLPVEKLIQRILINMERWRWLPHHLPGRQILVNIAGYTLSVLEDEQIALEMPVIVGEIFNKTPVFSDKMQYVVINPYWNIPLSITMNELVPAQIKNPNYLTENKIRVFEGWDPDSEPIPPETIDWATLGKGIRKYRLRQDPGPDNSLGRFKFIFPNTYDVYLHDTPAHNLFNQNSRAFSHGCIRVSEPAKLAHYLLKDNQKPWDEAAIAEQLASGERKIVVLKDPVPVHLLYRTVYVDHGTKQVFFYPDVYGRDEQLLSSFFARSPQDVCLSPPE